MGKGRKGIAPTTYSNGMGTTAASSASSADEAYDLFLSVLTTQLETQNPLDPTSTDEMTSQLISYSQVEQQIQTNEYLESLVLSTNEQSAEAALGFIGKDVTYTSASQDYSGGDLTWSLDVPQDTESLKFRVFDESGSKVYEADEAPSSQSTHEFVWNGSTTSDGTAEAGTYTLKVSAAQEDGSITFDAAGYLTATETSAVARISTIIDDFADRTETAGERAERSAGMKDALAATFDNAHGVNVDEEMARLTALAVSSPTRLPPKFSPRRRTCSTAF